LCLFRRKKYGHVTPGRTATIAIVVLALGVELAGQRLSFSTDFDGVGTGGSFSITVERPTPSRPPTPSVSRPPPVDAEQARIQRYLEDRYQEQLRDVQRRAEAERVRQRIEQERAQRNQNMAALRALLDQLERLEANEPSVIERATKTQEVLALQKQFEAERTSYASTLPSYRQRLAATIDNIHVPPPPHPLHYRQILIRGASTTPAQAEAYAAQGLKNPFTDQAYDDVFAFGVTGFRDAPRVIVDHFAGHFDQLSAATEVQAGRLFGATADEVVCHSNGCRVAQVLIVTGKLKVGRLRMLGADNAALELDYLASLKQSHRLSELSLFMLHGDPVPLINRGWQIMDDMAKIGGPLQSFSGYSADVTYQLLGLAPRPAYSPAAEVQVRTLSHPVPSLTIENIHGYDKYARVIKGWRLQGCLDVAGTLDRRCVIY
jgi:hypothetical protein